MKMKSFILLLCLGTGVLANAQTAPAPDTTGIHYAASLAANAGGGDFAPYYIASNRHGVVTQPVGTQLRLAAWKPLERPVELPPQTLTAPERTGFTLVEWGGAELS